MILTIYTIIHVVISLVAILSGLVVLFGLLAARALHGWTAVFLATTAATSVTGFFFRVHHLMPSHDLGIISLLVLALAYFARYNRRLLGGWRKTYVYSAMLALYLNIFVLNVQLFEKVPSLHALAPTQTEEPFKRTQLAVLALFIVLSIAASFRFRRAPVYAA